MVQVQVGSEGFGRDFALVNAVTVLRFDRRFLANP